MNTCSRGPLPPKPFDVVVIGGGAHGVAIARACALGGKSTLLLEQHDFGAGATSRSARSVGDVLTDLDRGDLALARESLRERDRLLVERGHLVRPVPGFIALGPERRRSALEVRFGLWLRRKLGACTGAGSDDQAKRVRSILGGGEAWTLLPFEDAVCEFPERLVAEWMGEAAAAGAVVRNYCRVEKVKLSGGEVSGVVVRDGLSGEEQFVRATWVVNATGQWNEHLGAAAAERARSLTVSARMVHLVLRRFPGAPSAAVYGEGVDGGEVVLLPWNGQLLFGSTRLAERTPATNSLPSDAEIEVLSRSFEKLFPRIAPEATAAFAGTSAVAAKRGFGPGLVRNREVVVEHSAEGARRLVSVFGGALTTSACAARECGRKIGFTVAAPPNCEYLSGSSNGMEIAFKQWARTVVGMAGISEATARGIATWHGRRALCIVRMAASDQRFRDPLCPHTEHIVAEAVNAVRYERAVTLADILLRRVPVALSTCWSGSCTEIAARRIGQALRWSESEIDEQIASLETERVQLFVRPKVLSPVRVLPDLAA